MCRFRVITLSLAAMAIASVTGAQQSDKQAPKIFTLSGEMLRGYQSVQRNLVEAAEKMPEANYGFKPTPEIRPFGQLVAHAALAQFGTCSLLKGEPSPRKDEKEDAPRTRAEAIALLKASTEYCDPLVTPLTDTTMPEMVKAKDMQVAKGLLPASLISHGQEMYGTMAVYLRLKGIVPPTTERNASETKKSQ
ncbi:MAG TPA: DinB family protein [Vicinamibacterales bacterium]|nr:DinB family protein [Vicinamibacterales bacterium]